MKYYIIDLNYSPNVGYVVFVTDNKQVMDDYHNIVAEIDDSVDYGIDNIVSKYTRKLGWIVFGPRGKEIYRLIVPDGDFSTIHDTIIQFFAKKNKGEGI